MSSEDTKLKNAASLLIKGGTLTGEPCEKCGGVMIRFGDVTTCVSCGEKKAAAQSSNLPTQDLQQPAGASSDLGSCAEIVEKKIAKLTSELDGEVDLLLQKQKAELLESYLRILEKVRSLAS